MHRANIAHESQGDLALRALRDCGVIRARWDHPGYLLLRHWRVVTYQVDGDAFLYRLNDRGNQYARRLRCGP